MLSIYISREFSPLDLFCLICSWAQLVFLNHWCQLRLQLKKSIEVTYLSIYNMKMIDYAKSSIHWPAKSRMTHFREFRFFFVVCSSSSRTHLSSLMNKIRNHSQMQLAGRINKPTFLEDKRSLQNRWVTRWQLWERMELWLLHDNGWYSDSTVFLVCSPWWLYWVWSHGWRF